MIWLVVLAFSFACGQEEVVPKIIMDAEDYYGFPDRFFRLEVQTNTVTGATFHWLRDGVEITKDTTPPFSQFGNKILVPTNQGKEYAGTYQIVMNAKAGTIKGRKVTVDFTYLGSFDANLPPNYKPDVIVGQANFVKCPKHEAGSGVIYKWGKSSEISGTKFMESKKNYIVLDDGTLFYSNLEEDDVTTFNQNAWTCGMEGKVNDDSKFRWAENVKTQLNKIDTNMTTFGPKIVTTLPKKQAVSRRTCNNDEMCRGRQTKAYHVPVRKTSCLLRCTDNEATNP